MDAAPLLTDQRPALLRSATVPSPLGELLLVASPVGLVQVFLPSSKGVPASSEEPTAQTLWLSWATEHARAVFGSAGPQPVQNIFATAPSPR